MMKIKQERGQKIFFTSDTHYHHTNICRGISNWPDGEHTRDYNTLDEMNNVIVNSINLNVMENDILFHLGDWSFGGFEKVEEFRNRIVCKNIHLILGNHDHHIERNKGNIKSLFSSVHEYLDLEIDDYRFILMHYPIASWNNMNKGVIHLHGHVHLPPDKKISKGKAMDVGMDGNNMELYSLMDIINIMDKQPIAKLSLPQDHHEPK